MVVLDSVSSLRYNILYNDVPYVIQCAAVFATDIMHSIMNKIVNRTETTCSTVIICKI